MELTRKTVGECLAENAKKYGSRTALETADHSCSFYELDRWTDAIARRLRREWGIKKGTHVGLWSVNSQVFVLLFLGLQKLGAVPIPINTCYKEKEIAPIVSTMDIELLFYGEGWKDLCYEKMIPSIREMTSSVCEFVSLSAFGDGCWMEEKDFSEEDLHGEVAETPVASEDTACIILTSGTTLSPKGAILTYYNIVNDCRRAAEAMRWSPKDKVCIALPMFHCFGLITEMVGSVVNGLQMYILPYFRTQSVWDAIENRGCTVLNGVPSIFLALVRKPEYQERISKTLKSGIIGGAVVMENDYLEICRHFPEMHLQSSYGMTEASSSISFVDWDAPLAFKAVSAGKLLEGIQGRVTSVETGEVLTGENPGEIELKGFNITQGYYGMPKETQEVFTEDGWFRTGDLGYFDPEGNLFITGRRKELIIRAGENISVVEIEHVFRKSEMVKNVKVVGVASSFRQEEIVAVVIPSESYNETGLREFLKSRLADYKIPQYICTVEELPYTGSGKINIPETKEIAEQFVEKTERQGKTKE